MGQILLMSKVFFTQDSEVEDLFGGAFPSSEPSLFFSTNFFSVGFEYKYNVGIKNPQKLTQLSPRSH